MTEITDLSRNKLKEYLNQSDFYTKLRQCDRELINFFFENFDLLIHIIFEDHTSEYRDVQKCFSFLISRDHKIHNRLLQETKLIDFLTSYPLRFTIIDHGLRLQYKDLLEAFLLPDPCKFNKNVGNSQLFSNLISVCDYNSSFEILQKVISEEDQKVIYHLLTIDFLDSVSHYIKGDQIINFNSQRILIQFIDRGCENFVAECLIKNALLSSFVDYTIENHKIWKNFRFIENIYRYSLNYLKNSNWKTIEVIISSCIDDFRKIIMNTTDKWCDTENTCISIIVEILNYRNTLYEKDILLFKFLIEKFFSMAKCSILHLSVLKYVTLFHKLGKLNLKLLNETNLVTKIIECYKHREELPLCNYFGQIREISILITPLIDKEKHEEWNSIVVKKNKEIYKLINTDSTSNSLPFRCQKKIFFSMQNKSFILIISFIFISFLVFIVFVFLKRKNPPKSEATDDI